MCVYRSSCNQKGNGSEGPRVEHQEQQHESGRVLSISVCVHVTGRSWDLRARYGAVPVSGTHFVKGCTGQGCGRES